MAKNQTQAPVHEDKAPKQIAVREVVPWFIVAIMAFAITGIITGWFLRSDVAVETKREVALVLKDNQR